MLGRIDLPASSCGAYSVGEPCHTSPPPAEHIGELSRALKPSARPVLGGGFCAPEVGPFWGLLSGITELTGAPYIPARAWPSAVYIIKWMRSAGLVLN